MRPAICGKASLAACCLALLTAASGDDGPVVEMSNAFIASRDEERLHVVFAAEGQPTLLFKPRGGAWDWRDTSKIVISVENPGAEPATLLLQVDDGADRSLNGKIAIAPVSTGDLALRIEAPAPRAMGMIAGPSLAAAGLAPSTLPVTATEGLDRRIARRIRPPRDRAPESAAGNCRRPVARHAAERGRQNGLSGHRRRLRPISPRPLAGKGELGRDASRPGSRGGAGACPSVCSNPGTRPLWRAVFAPDLQGKRVFPHRAPGWPVVARHPRRARLLLDRHRRCRALRRDLCRRPRIHVPRPAGPRWRTRHALERSRRPPRARRAARPRVRPWPRVRFYTANLERKFGVHWRSQWRDETVARLTAWGFNTIGNWSDPELSAMHRLPYTVPLWPEGEYAKVISGEDWWGPMPDPFDPFFAEAADKMARNAAARFGGDPWLIGYFVDNELAWGRRTPAYPQQYYALVLGALAAGRQSQANSAFTAYLRETYHDPERLAQAWGMPLNSWDDLGRAGFTPPPTAFDNSAVIGDLAAFTRRYADAYYRIVAEALRRHDPDHLYLGSRFAWQTAEAVEACARWCDVVSFNRYRRSIADDPAEWTKFHALGNPALIGEFHFGSVDRGLFWEGLVGVGRESERGPAYARYLRAVADNPDFVGAHWFQYLDEPLTGRTLDGENAHIGFVTIADLPYQDLASAAREANLAVLHRLKGAME